LGYSLYASPLAVGSQDDFTLNVRFHDMGLPTGSQVHITHFGASHITDCYTVNSVADETAECPSAAVAPLFRSTRAALPPRAGAGTAYVNTVPTEPIVRVEQHAAHMVVTPRQGSRAIAAARDSFTVHAELSTRGYDCVVRTNGLASDPIGFGYIVPAPWRWPNEGVPMFLDTPHQRGQCVSGGNGGEPCSEADQCAGGYCQLKSKKCYDAHGEDGISQYHTCTKSSECPYGTCYGFAGSQQRGAYAHMGAYLECRAANCYAATPDPLCALGDCQSLDVSHWWAAGNTPDLFAAQPEK
jgi:hypothetical protein